MIIKRQFAAHRLNNELRRFAAANVIVQPCRKAFLIVLRLFIPSPAPRRRNFLTSTLSLQIQVR
jgi:hypothetical protein